MRGNSEVSLTFRVRTYWAEDVAQWVEYFLSIHEAPGLHLSIAQTGYGWHTLVILAGSRAGNQEFKVIIGYVESLRNSLGYMRL